MISYEQIFLKTYFRNRGNPRFDENFLSVLLGFTMKRLYAVKNVRQRKYLKNKIYYIMILYFRLNY